jgi:polyribonucleotide nucleotidyltransferase
VEENKLNTQSVEFEYGNKTVKIETGKIARQATSSIIVTIDNLVVLTTMVARTKEGFLPIGRFLSREILCCWKNTWWIF